MKIKETITQSNKYGSPIDVYIEIEVDTDEYAASVDFGEGEPEDMTLDQDLACVYDIKDLLAQAYRAGERKEGLEIITEIIKDDTNR